MNYKPNFKLQPMVMEYLESDQQLSPEEEINYPYDVVKIRITLKLYCPDVAI